MLRALHACMHIPTLLEGVTNENRKTIMRKGYITLSVSDWLSATSRGRLVQNNGGAVFCWTTAQFSFKRLSSKMNYKTSLLKTGFTSSGRFFFYLIQFNKLHFLLENYFAYILHVWIFIGENDFLRRANSHSWDTRTCCLCINWYFKPINFASLMAPGHHWSTVITELKTKHCK